MRRANRAAKLMLDCVRAQPLDGPLRSAPVLDDDASAELVRRAAGHRVSSMVYLALRDTDAIPPACLEVLQQAHDAALRGHLRALVDLPLVVEVLDHLGAPWAVVKGPALAEVAYQRPDLRSYGDLDVVVRPADFRPAVEALQAAGARLADLDWVAAREELAGEVAMVLPHGTPLDLHWDLHYHHESRQRFSLDVDGMLSRTRSATLGGVAAPILDATDTLLHLCTHATHGGGARLLWLKDVERSLVEDPPDWQDLVARAGEQDVGLVVAVLLDRAERVVLAPVDRAALAAVGGQPWRWLVRWSETLAPVERTQGAHAVSSLVVRATRRDVRRSLGSVVRRAITQAARAAGRRDTGDGPSATSGAAVATEREQFFDAVEQEAEARRAKISP